VSRYDPPRSVPLPGWVYVLTCPSFPGFRMMIKCFVFPNMRQYESVEMQIDRQSKFT